MVHERDVHVDGLSIHYREWFGGGTPVLLVHGWPTSSRLWREIIYYVAATGRRTLALDLPGFGGSDKPPDAPYTLRFQASVLEGFLEALCVEHTALVVHDLGGPVGLLWAVRHPERVERLVLFDTFPYARLGLVERAALGAARHPRLGRWLTSPTGLAWTLRLGLARGALTEDALEGYLAPFRGEAERDVLRRTLCGLDVNELAEVGSGLRQLRNVPTLIAWADRDRLVSSAHLRRLERDLPQAQVVKLRRCGHFLPEDRPDKVGALLEGFLRPGAEAAL